MSDETDNLLVVGVFRDVVRASDQDAVGRIVAATGRFNAEEIAVARELVQARLAQGAASGYEFLFLETGERLLGYACHGRIPGTASSHDLYWIAVDPALQGKGAGRALLAEAEIRARAACSTAMWVETAGRDDYAGARGFYERNGYLLAARLPDFYAPGDDKLVYRKELRAG